MSRRKQSNPKPFLKSDCSEEATVEMTVEKDRDHDNKLDNNLIIGSKETDKNKMNPDIEELLIPKSEKEDDVKIKEEIIEGNNEPEAIPKIRLNMLLASDPALKPDAKDLKYLQEHTKRIDKLISTASATPIKNSKSDNTNLDAKSKSLQGISSTSRLKVFMCLPCGIGFSSHSTLEAHQAYYCSHRPEIEDDSQINVTTYQDKDSEPLNKIIKTGKMYSCMHCSYSADKKVSLNRHMRMHQSSPTPSSNASNDDDNTNQLTDRYCSECDIKFSSVKTYRAHKLHYCSSRRTDEPTTPKSEFKQTESISPLRSSNSPSKLVQPFLALPTSPILVIPYSLIKAGNIFSSPISVTPNADMCYTLENGNLKPLATVLSTESTSECNVNNLPTHSNLFESEELIEGRSKSLNEELTKKLRKDGFSRETNPLDLSVRPSGSKFHHQSFLEGKENLSIRNVVLTPDHIICTPSLPNSPSHTPSPKRKILSPHDSHNSLRTPEENSNSSSLKVIDAASNLFPNLLCKSNLDTPLTKISHTSNNNIGSEDHCSNLSNLPAMSVVTNSSHGAIPQAFLKQGVSKCKECNIVFCKYENYLAHKQHYCSARIQDELVDTKSNSNQSSNTDQPAPTVSYHQLICAACGIKYTSLDNLRAHQSYYCPQAGETIKQSGESNNLISTDDKKDDEEGSNSSKFKCPICDVINLSASENRKHLESHSNIKSFRCSICRYKGNTLRGVRAHIRIHFENKKSDINEENFMSLILEENGLEYSTSAICEENTLQSFYNCEICNYSSFKSNMIRHMKTVHAPQEIVDCPKSNENDKIVLNGEINFSKCKDTENDSRSPPLIPKIEDDGGDSELELSEKDDNSCVINNKSSPMYENQSTSIDQKYCQTCDIKFNYMKTYLAHKQFYCKKKENEDSSIISIYNKSKETLESSS